MKQIIIIFLIIFSSIARGISPEHLAIVIVDMQNGFYVRADNRNSVKLRNLIKKQVELIKWSNEYHLPILVFEYDEYGETDVRVMSHTNPDLTKTVVKDYDGGFDGAYSRQQALKFLFDHNIQNLIVTGVNGDACIYSTVVGALQNNFRVYTSYDLVGNLNTKPPVYPDCSWAFESENLFLYPSLDKLLK